MKDTQGYAIDILRKTPPFSIVDTNVLLQAIDKNKFKFINLNAGQTTVINKSIAIVEKGELEAQKSKNGKNSYLKKFGEGEILGIANLFDDNKQYICTFKAKKDTTILVLEEKAILKIINSSSDFSAKFIKLLCEKIRYLNRRIDAYTKTSIEQKLIEFISQSQNQENSLSYVEMSMSSLSSALNIGRASLYRVINQLEENEVILKEGKKIYLLKEV